MAGRCNEDGWDLQETGRVMANVLQLVGRKVRVTWHVGCRKVADRRQVHGRKMPT